MLPIALKVLVLEDQPDDAELMVYELRRAGYKPDWRRVHTEAQFLLELGTQPDLILADYNLPQFDGIHALELLNQRNLDIPFIIVSGSIGEEVAVRAMQHGASDYLIKDRIARLGPAVSNALEQKRLRDAKKQADQELRDSQARLASILASAMDAIITVDKDRQIILFNTAAEIMFGCLAQQALTERLERFMPEWSGPLNRLATMNTTWLESNPNQPNAPVRTMGMRLDGIAFPLEASISFFAVMGQKLCTIIIRDITERLRAEAAVREAHTELEHAYETTLEGWSKALELRDKETEGHTLRVTDLTMKLAQAMHIPTNDLIHIRRGALLHDIGKLGVPDNILLKPGPLTDEEWAIMRQHPTYAYQMLAPIRYLAPALDIPLAHHERWNGGGYPRGLTHTDIPLPARLFAVVDVWDALSFDRPYRRAWPMDRVIDHIQSESGKHFDPAVVEVFLSVIQSAATADPLRPGPR